MKTIIFGILFCLGLTTNFFGQNIETVYIRIQEPMKMSGGALEANMVIIKPDNTIEQVPLKKLKLDGSDLDVNGVIIKAEIEKWLKKGFKIISYNNSGDSILRSEIFLQKE